MEKITEVVNGKLISYRWWNSDKTEIKPEHVQALEESAENRIFEMIQDGWGSGELNDNIHMTDDDPEDGVDYSGWWSIKTVEPEDKLIDASVMNDVVEALTQASKSDHASNCECKGEHLSMPHKYCTCHVRQALIALDRLKKN